MGLASVSWLVVWLLRTNIARRWLRIFSRAAGALLVLPLLLGLLLLLTMGACATHPRIIVSPDSQHVAEHYFEPGFLGRDYTVVSVRRRWSVWPDVVPIRRAQRLDEHTSVLAGQPSSDDPLRPERSWQSGRV